MTREVQPVAQFATHYVVVEKHGPDRDLAADYLVGVSSICRQKISKIDQREIEHHSTERHMLYGAKKKGGKRRWQSGH